MPQSPAMTDTAAEATGAAIDALTSGAADAVANNADAVAEAAGSIIGAILSAQFE